MTQDVPPRAPGTRATGRRRRSDAARNIELLLAAARTLFDERGADVPLDEVARRAGVGNATLYRNFPSRGDLLVAVYSEEVDALCEQGTALLGTSPPEEALFRWLDLFVVHVATRRPLALAAISHEPDDRRGELADRWHTVMRSTTAALLAPAQENGAVRHDLSAADLLALTNATALASADPSDAVRLMHVLRGGVETRSSAR
ncbi:helix-turn-helix transcriptional regulator [Frankia sp. CNm7]|uniref:Helix-turn-helix transcriptional regulator n=1 Tax=Frankia nepalensis TaxID=1836974 RepID=A0A937RCT3_9ACTN|nr:TetR/AcrR family transcriptional regulator [Frankia nepalensis]MBL7498418.1 helix-turn-helix transcriptional regulator [Frankia nepalensis]MBL7509968.1 helix-turn-helix transcriptional regulator [Frankia nepalensis]MBL7520186.1 helix-turn-helix transcriptional regulator [Frankia nepalensis]MBL7629748.1 helix-turn-helix transcriptional regulator [Frankia nepalensis]